MRKENDSKKEIEKEYFNSLDKIPGLTNLEILELFKKYKNGDENARKEIIETNLRLVLSIAKKYQRRDTEFLDLFEDGYVGLIRAVDVFDMDRGLMFSTLATKAITNEIITGIEKREFALKAAPETVKEYYKFAKRIQLLSFKLGKEPTKEEVMKELGITEEKYNFIIRLTEQPISLSNKLFDDDCDTMNDMLEDRKQSTDEPIMQSELSRLIIELVEETELTDRERNILILKYGLYGKDSLKLDEIGEIYNVKKQRISQIEIKALEKLKRRENGHKTKQLKDFL